MPNYDVVCLGMAVCDILAGPVDASIFDRDTTKVPSIEMRSGGDAMTQAVISSRLGCKTALASKVGNDAYGRFLLDTLTAEGIGHSHMRIGEDGIDTAVSIVLVGNDGQRSFIASKGLNNITLCLEDLDMDLICGANFLSYGSLCFMKSLDPVVGEAVFREARRHGVKVVADCCANVYHYPPEVILNTLSQIDYFVPSEEEAFGLTQQAEPRKMAQALFDYGCKNLIIKLGTKGCYVKSPELEGLMPAFSVDKVVDTTGAGDNFVGGLLSALNRGLNLVKAVQFAQAAAAVSIPEVGATKAVRSRGQVDEFLKTQITEGVFKR